MTECLAAATDDDYSWRHARNALLEGRAAAMCLTCRSTLEAYYGWRDVSHFSNKGGSSIPEQHRRIRQLVREAEQNGCYSNCYSDRMPLLRDIEQLSNREAAVLLDELNVQKAKGWKKRLRSSPYPEFADIALDDFVASLPKGNGTRAKRAIVRCDIKTLAQLKATDPYTVFSAKNAGVGAVKALLDAGVWPGVSLSSATRKKIKPDREAVAKSDREFLLALEAAKNDPHNRAFEKLLQLGSVQKKRVPQKVSKKQNAMTIAKVLRALSAVLDTNQKVALTQILQDAATATAKKVKK